MFGKVKNFLGDESGAVTVDWVVLTAAIVGLGITAVTPIVRGSNSMGEVVGQSLSDGSVAELDFSAIHSGPVPQVEVGGETPPE